VAGTSDKREETTMGQKRAKIGGEVGANGEFYEGGKFIATTDHSKRHGSVKRKPRKVQIRPFEWVIAEPGQRPIFSIVGAGAAYIDRYDTSKGIAPYAPAFEMYGDRMYNGETLENIKNLCDRFNAGEIWI
jgi:hypothetical protein